MTGALTAELQAERPELDELYEDLGQRVRVFRQQSSEGVPDTPDLPEYDERGELITPPPTDPTPATPGAGASLGEYPCVVYQLDAKDRADLGGDIAVPLWEGIVHWSAELHQPGLLFEVFGGELPEPLLLTPVGDVVDEGTQRVAWTFVARATGGRS